VTLRPGPSITAPAKIVKMKEDIQTQIERIHEKFETFMAVMKASFIELTLEVDKLDAMVNGQPERAPLNNVILFSGNGRKPKLLKAEQQPAA
jgi:hypothetical protein